MKLTKYLDENDLLSDEQNSFRSNRSCEDHVFAVNCNIRNNQNIFASFKDLKKAFDFIEKDLMLYKLQLNNNDGKIYKYIQ